MWSLSGSDWESNRSVPRLLLPRALPVEEGLCALCLLTMPWAACEAGLAERLWAVGWLRILGWQGGELGVDLVGFW
jgi:hypothetical protein